VTIAELYEEEKPASIKYFDKKRDLAILETDLELKVLKLSKNFLWSGYWVMTLGSAAGYEGSVSFGNIVNVTNEDVLITNNISEGNSGGPLIDNEGKVIGIVTWGSEDKGQQFNGAKSLDVFCEKIIKCEFETKGQKTWYNYEE
jgi:S1-C subfamily serine protease